MKEFADERRILEQYALRTDSAVPFLLRLIELQTTAGDWQAVRRQCAAVTGDQSAVAAISTNLAAAAEHLGQPAEAVSALEALLAMDPDDPAELHFRLALLLHAAGDPKAKSHVLEALEAAPRYREAQKLLLKIVREKKN